MNLLSRLKKIKDDKDKDGVEVSQVSKALDEELGGTVRKNSFGTYLLLENEYSQENLQYPHVSREKLLKNLRLLRGIGPVTEREMLLKGYKCIRELADDPRWSREALFVQECIAKEKISELCRRGACDYELMAFFTSEDLVFLDIETTGLWANQPLFLVGVLFKEGEKLKLQQFFARNLREEKPLLAAVYEKLKEFKVMVTYNGKKFDAPYIEGRWVEHRLFYKLHHYQLDLLYHARRHFREKYPDCRLITLEEKLLGQKRKDDIPGYLIPRTYYKFVKNGNPLFVKDIINHNAMDLVTLARILHIVSPEIKEDRIHFSGQSKNPA